PRRKLEEGRDARDGQVTRIPEGDLPRAGPYALRDVVRDYLHAIDGCSCGAGRRRGRAIGVARGTRDVIVSRADDYYDDEQAYKQRVLVHGLGIRSGVN